MFVGRAGELAWLEEKYRSQKAEFVVLYGRRRIGKTALIREFIRDKRHVFYSAVQTTDSMQRIRMSGVVTEALKTRVYGDVLPNWTALFDYVADHASDEKRLILVMDEFPFMAQGNAEIPSLLQHQWDLVLSERNVMLILCGSSMSFMQKEVLSEKNPLYGRTTGILKLGELTFPEARAFFGDDGLESHLSFYAVFSGVPYYLSLIDPNLPLRENLLRVIFRYGAVLMHEPEFLLKQELREVAQYNAIIESIASGDVRISEIAQKTGIAREKLPYYLDSLMDLGFVRREYPVTMKTKERSKSRSGLYQLDNGFFRFYYRFVHPHLSELSEGAVEFVLDDIVLPELPHFVSRAFEAQAISDVRTLALDGRLPFRPLRIGRWWEKDSEIDLVALDLKGRALFGECTWRGEKTGEAVLNRLRQKAQMSGIGAGDPLFILFSKSGFTDGLLALAASDESLYLVGYEDSELSLHGFGG